MTNFTAGATGALIGAIIFILFVAQFGYDTGILR